MLQTVPTNRRCEFTTKKKYNIRRETISIRDNFFNDYLYSFSVRSFGTEDRETQYPVAPQNQVYDYILFRGSDIKDIRVLNNVSSLPNDPAIMQLSVPPTLGPIGGAPYQQPQFNHPVVGPTQYPQYHPMGIPPALRPGPLAKQPSELSQQPPVELPPLQMLPPQQTGQVKDQGPPNVV